jgi:hypothetical protein
MRYLIAALVLAVAAPAAHASSPKSVCKTRCDSMGRFCSGRSTSKQSRKACKTDRKNCKKQCK